MAARGVVVWCDAFEGALCAGEEVIDDGDYLMLVAITFKGQYYECDKLKRCLTPRSSDLRRSLEAPSSSVYSTRSTCCSRMRFSW